MENFSCLKTGEPINISPEFITEIPLSSITEYCQTRIFQPENIACLCEKIEPIATIHPYKVIHALLPIARKECSHSLVLTAEDFRQVAATHKKITESLLHDHLHIQPQLYRFALAAVFDQCKYRLPCSLPNYCLIPLGGVTEKDTIWVNPAQIAAISEELNCTELILRNGFRIACKMSRQSIHNSMLLGFICQGIIKREWQYESLQSNLPLQEYLHLPGTREINHVIQNHLVADIPGKRGDWFRSYFDEKKIEVIRALTEKEERLLEKNRL